MTGAGGWSSRLDAALDHFWGRIDDAARGPGSALRQLIVANAAAEGADARVMVLRNCDRNAATLVFHTDLRSPKVAAFSACPDVAIVGYDHGAAYQVRLAGIARIERDGAAVDAAWAAVRDRDRCNFMTELPPGAIAPVPTDGQPAQPDSASARANFARVVVALTRIEWLDLAASGHRRGAYLRGGAGWAGHWLIP